MPDAITRWTAWMSMAALAGAIAIRQQGTNDQPARGGSARWLWTLGCVLLWIHVGCAFHFQHHWSHAAAYTHTAQQTAATTGFDWGGGVYFNYLLMLLWTCDALWWWLAPRSYESRPAVVRRFVTGFAVFMAFNATVIFGSGVPRWVALAVCAALLMARPKKATTPTSENRKA